MRTSPPTWTLLVFLAFGVRSVISSAASEHGQALLQSWTSVLDSSSGHDTPVTRVVNLLKNMGKTVQAEADEDEGLYRKLQCWCNDNNWAKSNSIEKSEAQISQLDSTIESLTSSTAELRASIKELETELAADKKALAEATALRGKQLEEFHNLEMDQIQAVENLKAALTVLEKHEAAPKSTVAGGPVFKSERDSWSLVQVHSQDMPSKKMRSFDNFMRDSGLDDTLPANFGGADAPPAIAKPKFLQQQGSSSVGTESELSVKDKAVVELAIKSASAFVQARHMESYYPAYNFRSSEIVGILKQLKEEMEGDLSEAQKNEQQRAEVFAELREAKTQEIDSGYKRSEEKEDQLANQDNALAEAKEDLAQEKAALAADQTFVKNLKETCADAGKNYNLRKAARIEEMKAISETIEILQKDVARDAMSGTFSFVQTSSMTSREAQHRRQASRALRRAAKVAQDPQLSMLATTVELDAFTKVKKAIDHMIAMLKQQSEDEVKKLNWCKAELQSNEMSTAKGESKQADLEAKIATLEADIVALETGIADAKAQIAETQLDLQRASMTRKQESQDFQKVVADQTVTVEVLNKALDRLATYYDLVQTKGSSWIQRQTPDVVQMKYQKSEGASGVMEMVEKLIYDARELMAGSKASESAAQAAYEQLIADSNDSIHALQKEVVAKIQFKSEAQKEKRETHADLADTIKELEGLAKYNAELHAECDYVVKNFDVRQNGRGQEIEALQQAKQILNGASLT